MSKEQLVQQVIDREKHGLIRRDALGSVGVALIAAAQKEVR